MSAPIFYYDVSSPFAYLAAERIDDLIPEVSWRPVAFGFLLRVTGRVPWSLNPDTRPGGMEEVAARATARGLPEVRWPGGWPAESYSLLPLRVLHAVIDDQVAVRRLTHAFYASMFAQGVALDQEQAVIEAATSAGFDADAVRQALSDDSAKQSLKAATDEALAAGVVGVPTVATAGRLFWGDDRLDDAATAAGS